MRYFVSIFVNSSSIVLLFNISGFLKICFVTNVAISRGNQLSLSSECFITARQ